MSNRLTGKAAYIQIAGVKVGMTKISKKTERKLAETTDSTDYDPTSDLIWPTQLAVMAPVELTVEGKYNLVTTPANVLNILYTSNSNAPIAIVLGLNATTVWGHGNFDVSNYSEDDPVDDTVTFSLDLKSNGLVTLGS